MDALYTLLADTPSFTVSLPTKPRHCLALFIGLRSLLWCVCGRTKFRSHC